MAREAIGGVVIHDALFVFNAGVVMDDAHAHADAPTSAPHV
jgi:hypothetical protein